MSIPEDSSKTPTAKALQVSTWGSLFIFNNSLSSPKSFRFSEQDGRPHLSNADGRRPAISCLDCLQPHQSGNCLTTSMIICCHRLDRRFVQLTQELKTFISSLAKSKAQKYV